MLPPIDPSRVKGDGSVDSDLLRARVILRENCRYTGQTLGKLDFDYPTKVEWDQRPLPGIGSRRLYRAARGRHVRGDAVYFDPVTEQELPLWKELEQHHPGLIRFVQPWIFAAIDPNRTINGQSVRALIAQWPVFLRRQCCERVKENPRQRWVLRYTQPSEELVKQLTKREEIEGPFAALLLTRWLYSNGAEAIFFRVRRMVMAAIYTNREVGQAFGEDKGHLMCLVRACLSKREDLSAAGTDKDFSEQSDFDEYILDLEPITSS